MSQGGYVVARTYEGKKHPFTLRKAHLVRHKVERRGAKHDAMILAVTSQVLSEAQSSAIVAGGGGAMSGVNHVAHLAGALLGVLLIWLISRIPDGPADPHPVKGTGPNTSTVPPTSPQPPA